jgi:2-methylcitrate dehydratase PrpD
MSDEAALCGFADWIADWAVAGEPDLVEEAEAEARLALVDTLACMLASRGERQAVAAEKALLRGREVGAVQPVGGGPSLNLGAAAFLNGLRAHAQDFDDCEVAGATHPSAVLFGALLALAQAQGLSLGAVCRAWTVGYECIVRLGEALGYGHYRAGWHATTATLCPVGAAAAVAQALRLDAAGIRSAMTLATSASAGLKLQFGSDAKALHAGQAARAGLQAALLAEAGMSASAEIFEQPFGFLDVYGTQSSKRCHEVMAAAQLGAGTRDYPILRKPWPTCAYTHRAIEAAEEIAGELKPKAEDIDSVLIQMPEPYARVAGFTTANSAAEARFSTTYCVAATLLSGRLGPEDFSPDALNRPEISDLMTKSGHEHFPMGQDLKDMSADAPDRVAVRLRDGRTAERTVGKVRGGPARPMSRADILAKFQACGGDEALAQSFLGAEESLILRETGLFQG